MAKSLHPGSIQAHPDDLARYPLTAAILAVADAEYVVDSCRVGPDTPLAEAAYRVVDTCRAQAYREVDRARRALGIGVL